MLRYLNDSNNLILNSKCDYSDNIRQLWEWRVGANHNMRYCISIVFDDGKRKDFFSTKSRMFVIKAADKYLQQILLANNKTN